MSGHNLQAVCTARRATCDAALLGSLTTSPVHSALMNRKLPRLHGSDRVSRYTEMYYTGGAKFL